MGKLDETGVNNASRSLSVCLICNRIRACSHGQGGKTTVIEVPKCWAVRSLGGGCDEGKRLCVVFQFEWVWVGGCVEGIVRRWIWRLLQSKGHTSRQAKKKKNCFGCRALPCLGQPSSGCEAGRPWELSLEDSLSPRRRGAVRRAWVAERKSDWAPEVSRTDWAALSHCHTCPFSPCQPTNQHFGLSTTVSGQSNIEDSLVSIVQTANIPPFLSHPWPHHGHWGLGQNPIVAINPRSPSSPFRLPGRPSVVRGPSVQVWTRGREP